MRFGAEIGELIERLNNRAVRILFPLFTLHSEAATFSISRRVRPKIGALRERAQNKPCPSKTLPFIVFTFQQVTHPQVYNEGIYLPCSQNAKRCVYIERVL